MHDMQNSQCITACRALGLVGKYLTGPWMRLIEQDLRILDLNKYYEQAVRTLEKWSEDSSDVVTGRAPQVFSDVPMNNDNIYHELVKPADNDSETAELLQLIFKNILDDCLGQLQDQLPGGIYSTPTPQLISQAGSCVGNNISGERVFGQLDYQLKRAPNSKVTYCESKIMYSNNSTENWLSTMDTNTKEIMLDRARKESVRSRKGDRERQQDVEKQRQRHLQAKREEMGKKIKMCEIHVKHC